MSLATIKGPDRLTLVLTSHSFNCSKICVIGLLRSILITLSDEIF